MGDEQQFCLRWNNFQANITSQFEALRDDEDFTDVTIACEGQKIQAHKVVLSACSPFFKELFKTNPCPHPIIFMRDVEATHILALLEFMYAGEVNVAQAHLSTFLKTAESLKIRGLTDTENKNQNENAAKPKTVKHQISSSTTVTSSQDIPSPGGSPPPPKKHKSDNNAAKNEEDFLRIRTEPKVEAQDYMSDESGREDNAGGYYSDLSGGMEIIPQSPNVTTKEEPQQDSTSAGNDTRKLHSLDPRPCEECGRVYSNLSNLRQHMKLIHYPTYVQCPVCKKSFKTDLYLRRHIMSSHDAPHRTLSKQGFDPKVKKFEVKSAFVQ